MTNVPPLILMCPDELSDEDADAIKRAFESDAIRLLPIIANAEVEQRGSSRAVTISTRPQEWTVMIEDVPVETRPAVTSARRKKR